ncbi:hypothetical protein HPC62_00045 [Thermoleptolyngbya sichuanensis A183]|uniref:Uncharacterized protein n=1 Tax=Thermoleptolyngbya sichuanensis A183 TaxID=2737172 RepID=A0A6M8B311_9CYAN|nr:hypothetical protein [Thermoleptolyngbya sichuanensis]QKD80778.1 hypothetical protein HPC62_00045 [Thermoleptolyngbya sichuanensis A183]
MPKIKRQAVEVLPPGWRIYRVIDGRWIEIGSYVWRADAERTLRFLNRVTPYCSYVLAWCDASG